MLRHVPIFAGLSPAALNLLLQESERIDYPKEAVIVREGERGNRMFIIEKGRVRIAKNFGTPDQVELALFQAKDFFGEVCILETLPRIATAQAVTATTLYSLSTMAFYHLYQKMPAEHSILILNIARDLSRRLRHLDEIFAARH